MANLGLPTAEFAVNFDEGLGLKPATEEVINGLNLGGEFLDFTASLKECITGNETTDVGHLLGCGDDLG